MRAIGMAERTLALMVERAQTLGRRMPDQTQASVVHGDFRIDNTLLARGAFRRFKNELYEHHPELISP